MRSVYQGICGYYVKALERLSELCFRSYVIEKEFEGLHLQFSISDLCAREWYDDERTTTPETTFIKEHLLKPGDVVADCGAHHGLITLLAAKVVGDDGQVFAFDALPNNTSVILRNVELNSLHNVSVNNLALGSNNCRVSFLADSNGSVVESNGNSRTINVEMRTLDKFFDSTLHPDFLKIDVEGYENHLLRGAREILTRLPRFALEFHTSFHDNPHKELSNLYDLLNFNCYNIFIQLEIDGRILPMQQNIHTITSLLEHQNIHFFGMPKS